jgi:hypothetical protein
VPTAAEAQFDPAVLEAFALKPLPDARLDEEVDGTLLQYARAHPVLDVVAVAILDDDRIDPRAMQQMRQQQAGRTGADDAHLRRKRRWHYAFLAVTRTSAAIASA